MITFIVITAALVLVAYVFIPERFMVRRPPAVEHWDTEARWE